MNTKLERLLVDVRQAPDDAEKLRRLLHGIAREIVHADNPYEVRDLVEALKSHFNKIADAFHGQEGEPDDEEPDEDGPDEEVDAAAPHETRKPKRKAHRTKR